MGIMSEPEISPPVQTFAAAAGGVAAVTQGNVSEVRRKVREWYAVFGSVKLWCGRIRSTLDS